MTQHSETKPAIRKAMLEFGARLKKRRELLKLTQVELGRKVKISSKTISNLEYGYTFPSIPVYCAICRELQFRPPPLL